MLAQIKTVETQKQKQHSEIKAGIVGYNKIIQTIQERIKSNNKEIENFNKLIEQNLKEIDFLKGIDEVIITSFTPFLI